MLDSAGRLLLQVIGSGNATLYTMCFTGKALAVARCELCFASTHTTAECGLQGDTDPELPTRIKAIESAVLALTASQGKGGGPVRGSAEPCRLWNNNKINALFRAANMSMCVANAGETIKP
jgi:hypothetical protein